MNYLCSRKLIKMQLNWQKKVLKLVITQSACVEKKSPLASNASKSCIFAFLRTLTSPSSGAPDIFARSSSSNLLIRWCFLYFGHICKHSGVALSVSSLPKLKPESERGSEQATKRTNGLKQRWDGKCIPEKLHIYGLCTKTTHRSRWRFLSINI